MTPGETGFTSLSLIDQTLYANEGNKASLAWRNDEVVELLTDLRAALVADLIPTLDVVVSA